MCLTKFLCDLQPGQKAVVDLHHQIEQPQDKGLGGQACISCLKIFSAIIDISSTTITSKRASSQLTEGDMEG